MTFDTIDHLKHSDEDRNEIYPLEKYLVPRVRDIEYFNINKDAAISTHESISTLDQIKHILKLTDNCLKNITSNLNINGEIKTVRIDEPLYTEEDFDEKLYIKKIVEAKLLNRKIIYSSTLRNKFGIFSDNKNVVEICPKNQDINKTTPQNMDLNNVAENVNVKNVKFIEIKAQGFNDVAPRIQSKNLIVQIMPSVNIRSELIEQKFPSMDIEPNEKDNRKPEISQNIAIIKSNYGIENDSPIVNASKIDNTRIEGCSSFLTNEANNVDFLDASRFPKRNTQKYSFKENFSATPSKSIFYNSRNYHESNLSDVPSTSHSSSRKFSNLKKYGIAEIQQIYNPKNAKNLISTKPSVYHNTKSQTSYKKMESKPSYSFLSHKTTEQATKKIYSNTEYIPYSKLTIGGIKASDVQKYEGSSFIKQRKIKFEDDAKNEIIKSSIIPISNNIFENSNEDSIVSDSNIDYDDDFHIDKSESVDSSVKDAKENHEKLVLNENPRKQLQTLSPKNKIDVFDYVHQIETRDTSTQINDSNSLYKGTQTSPIRPKTLNTNNLQINEEENTRPDEKQSKFDVKNITTVELEKILSTFNSRLFIDTDMNNEHNINDANLSEKNTQTSPQKTVHIMTSPVKMIDKNLSPIKNNAEMSVQTNPIERDIAQDNIPETYSVRRAHGNISKSPAKQMQPIAVYSSSETQTDISQSDTSETLSLGEINLRILKKRYITILKQTDSQITSTSISTSLNSDIQMNSRKSEGEISIKKHKK